MMRLRSLFLGLCIVAVPAAAQRIDAPAAADRGPSIGNAELFMGLTRAGATAELHIFQKGRHGFGTGFRSPEFGDWMSQLNRFLTLGGFLPAEQQ